MQVSLIAVGPTSMVVTKMSPKRCRKAHDYVNSNFYNADNLYESPERSTGMYMYMLVFCRFTIAADVLNLDLYSGIPLYFYYRFRSM